jgi:16S rRNA (guanine(1405)-N(7))-methyltransferase
MRFEKEFITLIKQKKELSFLDDAFILEYLEKTLLSHKIPDLSIYSSFEQALRNKKIKSLLSEVRKQLREVYGLFLINPITANQIAQIRSVSDPLLQKILQQHRSTEERVPYYTTLYLRLFDDLFEKGLPKDFRLLDVACGYNPFAYQFLPTPPNEYVAVDLSSSELACVQQFFSQAGIVGTAFGADALSATFADFLAEQKFDVVFFLKALDSFETVKRHSSKKLLSAVQSPLIVVSFPLVSIGGKSSIQSSKRSWLERFCEKEGWEFTTFSLPNELFYLIQK